MTKQQLVDRVAQIRKISKTAAKTAVDLMFEGMTEEMAKGGRVEIRGFGSFEVRSYDSYTSRNPRTGESIRVKSKRKPHFKVGKELKERLKFS